MKENKKTYTLVLVAFLTMSAYFLADTVDAVIGRSLDAAPRFTAPLEQRDRAALEPRREMSDYSSILERGLFGDGQAPSAAAAAAAVETTSYKLIGTIAGEGFAGAVLEDSSGQAFYRINQRLPDGSMIVKVTRDRIILKKAGGATIELSIADDTKIVAMIKPTSGFKKISEGKWLVDQKEVMTSTENMNQILTQARALPYMENGKTVGFRISEITPGSIYEKIGLQNGDVIQKVNSQDVDDPAKFFQLYQGLRTEPNIVIDVIRGGQHQTMNYEIR
jgi:general secretion pathway protein C